MTSRIRKPTGEKTHSELPARTRHSDSTNASPPSNTPPPIGDADDDGTPAAEGNQLAAVTDLALARRRRATAHANRVYGTPNVERSVPDLDRQALDAKTGGGKEGGSVNFTLGFAPGTLAVYTSSRGRLERSGLRPQHPLRRVADDEPVGTRRLLRLPGRLAHTPRADAEGGTRVSGERLFGKLAARAVVSPGVLAVQIGPVKVW